MTPAKISTLTSDCTIVFFPQVVSRRPFSVSWRPLSRGGEAQRMTGPKLTGILIVIPILLIAACIVVPCMTPLGIGAGEASAVASIRAIDVAETTYRATYGGYAHSLANLGGADRCIASATTACLLDQGLAGGVKAGYHFAVVGSNPVNGGNTTFVVGAAPVVFGRKGRRRFCSSDKNVLRVDLNAGGSTTPPDGAQCAGFSALQ